MKDIKSQVSANLGALRKQRGITQAELAEKLNYSDKAISRWEKGDTLPDLNVLYEICQFYGITMNDLVGEECTASQVEENNKHRRMYFVWMCTLAGVAVWLFATIWFTVNLLTEPRQVLWICFIWALPFSCGVVMLIARKTFNWVVHFVLASVTLWTAICATVLHVLFFTSISGHMIWFIFIIGAPLQAMIFLFQKVWKSRTIVKTQAEVIENANRAEESNKNESDGE
ncbi:MAG: helix-turn-helix transcriptional regulator [Clostridia bacterium]|nr:helix-turn-helix transcriptional regulator [Clostridia bacterium]